MARKPLITMMILALIAACLLAASEINRPAGWSAAGLYGYWIVRILIETTLFAALLQLFSLVPYFNARRILLVICAAAASYVPYVMSVTTLDLVLGLPELGFSPGETVDSSMRLEAFVFELAYLLDNHILLCALLSLPLWGEVAEAVGETRNDDEEQSNLKDFTAAVGADGPPSDAAAAEGIPDPGTLLSALSPPFTGPVLRAEAQEHYVKLVGPDDTRMVLNRFSDVLRELPDDLGMQVHRSHWVADEAVLRVFKDGTNTRIALHDGSEIPVSRRYASQVVSRARARSRVQRGGEIEAVLTGETRRPEDV